MADSGKNIQNAKNLLRLFVQLRLDFKPGRKFITYGAKKFFHTQKGCFIILQASSLKEILAKTTRTYKNTNTFCVQEKLKMFTKEL